MNHLDRAKAALTRQRANEVAKSVGYNSAYNGYQMGYNAYQNPLIRVIGTPCDNLDPRVKLPSYRAITQALTIVQLAIQVHRQFIGTPRIMAGERGNPRAVSVLEKFWAETPIYGQMINEINADKGLASFVAQVIPATMRDGSQFFRLMQEPTTARINRAPIEGIRLFDSMLFEYVQDPANLERLILRYASPTNVIDIAKDDGYGELHFDKSPDFAWGLPIAYGTEFFAERFVRALIAYVNGHIRKGDPIGITLIGFAPQQDKSIGAVAGKQAAADMNLMKETVTTVHSNHKQAIERQRLTGQPQDQIISLPGDVTMLSTYYGAGIDLPPNFEQLNNALTNDIARGLKTPFSFLGLSSGASGGFSGELFKLHKEAMNLTAHDERRLLEMNCIRVINSRVLAASGIIDTPDAYVLDWETLDLDDDLLEAEAQKAKAEAVGLELANITTISTALSGVNDPDKALNDYLEEIDRPSWKV